MSGYGLTIAGYSVINSSGQFTGSGGVSTSGVVNAAGFKYNGTDIMAGICTTAWNAASISPVWVGWISAYTSTGSFLGKVLYC